MTLLILGILLFTGVHLSASLAPGLKSASQRRIGMAGYKSVFSLLLLASFYLIVTGWKSAEPHVIYWPVSTFRQPGIALVMIAMGLLLIGFRNSRIGQRVRHPQLTAVWLWALAHLAMNGDSRSIVLFSGMAVWSFVEIHTIGKREGDWIKADIPSLGAETVTAILIVLLVIATLYAHSHILGVQVLY